MRKNRIYFLLLPVVIAGLRHPWAFSHSEPNTYYIRCYDSFFCQIDAILNGESIMNEYFYTPPHMMRSRDGLYHIGKSEEMKLVYQKHSRKRLRDYESA